MENELPTHEEWSRLFEAATKVKALAPWEWMEEADLFGVQDPETGEVYYVSVMGTLGEHLAVAAYPGLKGLAGFWAMHEGMLRQTPEAFLLVPQLQVSFEDRETLSSRDRQLIKDTGFKFRGRQSWPQFRSWRPAHVPWYLEGWEARVLAHILEQALDVAPRFAENPGLLSPGRNTYLVRTARDASGVWLWQDSRQIVTAPPPDDIVIEIDTGLFDRLRSLPLSKAAIEIGVSMLPSAVQDGDERPYYPYSVLLVDAKSGFILATELLTPQPSMVAMWGRLAEAVASKLAVYQKLPGKLKVGTELLAGLLQPLSEELGLKVELAQRLPALEEAQASMRSMWR